MNLHKTLATVSGMTMLSRITGLIREFLIARAFGASAYTDAFFVAFRIPNLLRRLFAEGAFSQAFVPILAEYKHQKGEEATKDLIDKVATILIFSLVVTSILGAVGAPIIVYLMASGFAAKGEAYDLSVTLTQIMFPYIGFMSFVALSGGILNTWRQFKIPAFTPVLLNLSFIAASLFLAPYLEEPVFALGIAVIVGGILQASIQLPALKKIGMLPRITLRIRQAYNDPGVRRVLKQMLPATFAVSVAQISLIINTNIASHLQSGSVSWLSYADRLMELPTGLLGVALATVLLPSLSKAHADGNTIEYSALLDWGLRLTFLLALPAAIALAVLSVPLTTALYHYGEFSVQSVGMTARALIAYGVGLIGLILVKILAPGFYAKQDIKTPVKIGVGVLIATQLMNLLFVPWIQHAGLALSIGLGACLNASFLYWGLQKKGIYRAQSGWLVFFIRIAVGLCLLGFAAHWLAGYFDWIALQAQPFLRIGYLMGIIVICMVVYFGSLLLMGFRLGDFKRTSV